MHILISNRIIEDCSFYYMLKNNLAFIPFEQTEQLLGSIE